MIKKVLTVAKNLKTFSINDVLMFTGLELSDTQNILNNLVENRELAYKDEKYVFISKSAYTSTIIIKENETNLKHKKYGLNFVDAVEIFLQEYASQNCATETLKGYKSIFKTKLNPFFNDTLLEDITIENVNQFSEVFLKRGYAKKGVKNALALLNQLLKYFRNSGYSKSLCEFQVQGFKEKRKKEIFILDEKTIKSIKQLAKKHSKTLYLITEIILNLGLKFYEIIALEENDIDFDNNKIFITKISAVNVVRQIKAKNQRRIVDFPDEITPILREFLSHKTDSEQRVRKRFAKIKKELGLNDFKIDDFRHNFAYDFLQKGNSIEKLYLQLGDYSIQATMDKYQKFVLEAINRNLLQIA